MRAGDQLVAGEFRQIDEGLGPLRREAVAVVAVLDEQPRTEAESDGQPGRRQAEHVGRIGLRGVVVLARTLDAAGPRSARGGFGPVRAAALRHRRACRSSGRRRRNRCASAPG